jgi:LPXTG-motif cell wall-anchored protein
LRKLLLVSVLAIISGPMLTHAQNCQQSGNNQGQNSGCSTGSTRMDSGDSLLLTSGAVILVCLAGFVVLRRRKLA